MILENMTNVGESWFSYRKITQQSVCDFKRLSRNGDFFQNSVQNTRPTLQLIICQLQIYNFIYGMTGWIDKLGLYSCTPGLWKSVLPSCQSSSHSASTMTRSACGASITAYVFQLLGREESTQTERRIRMWGQRKG